MRTPRYDVSLPALAAGQCGFEAQVPERIVLTLIRCWRDERALGVPYGEPAWRSLAHAAALAPETIDDFNVWMASFCARRALRGQGSCAPGVEVLDSDEALLLECVGLLQRGRFADTVRRLSQSFDWRVAGRLARRGWPVAAGFADAGLILGDGVRTVRYCH